MGTDRLWGSGGRTTLPHGNSPQDAPLDAGGLLKKFDPKQADSMAFITDRVVVDFDVAAADRLAG